MGILAHGTVLKGLPPILWRVPLRDIGQAPKNQAILFLGLESVSQFSPRLCCLELCSTTDPREMSFLAIRGTDPVDVDMGIELGPDMPEHTRFERFYPGQLPLVRLTEEVDP